MPHSLVINRYQQFGQHTTYIMLRKQHTVRDIVTGTYVGCANHGLDKKIL